jgi:hypothetical protein
MDRQSTFLLALGMLIAASLVVSVSGWVLFARDRALHRADARAAGAGTAHAHHEAAEEE